MLAFAVSSAAIAGTTWTVIINDPADSSTIDDAVDTASVGDTMKLVQCIPAMPIWMAW